VIATPDLAQLERALQDALESGDESGLHVLGAGEISAVLAWPDAVGPHACKRLPVFGDVMHFEAFRSCFSDYLEALEAAGVAVHESRLEHLAGHGAGVVAYCVQPALSSRALGPAVLRHADPTRGRALLSAIVGHIAGTVRPTVGIDAQLSNWAESPRGLVYLDVTTPLLRDTDGRERLDTEVFLALLPAVFRPVVRRFLLASILDPYYEPRRAALDVAGNLHKEGLESWVPELVAIANDRLGIDLDRAEVDDHYRRDARLWALLQRARRVDRAWQRHVRRRPYPFLLPAPIDRRVRVGTD